MTSRLYGDHRPLHLVSASSALPPLSGPHLTAAAARYFHDRLNAGTGPAQVHQAVVDTAVHVLHGCHHAALIVHDHDRVLCLAATDPAAQDAALAHSSDPGGEPDLDMSAGDIQHGPGPNTEIDADPGVIPGPGFEPTVLRRWMACRVPTGTPMPVILCLYSEDVDSLGRDTYAQVELLLPLLSLAMDLAAARRENHQLSLELRGALDVGKAVGLLMATRRVSGDDALGIVRRSSQRSNLTLTQAAGEFVRLHGSVLSRR